MASNIDTRKAFFSKCQNVVLDPSVSYQASPSRLDCQQLLCPDILAEWLSGHMGRQVKLTQRFTGLRHEKSRFFCMYEVLKSFAKYSQGKLLLELMSEEESDDENEILEAEQVIDFERRISGRHRVPATIKFVIVNREDPDNILMTVGVKTNIADKRYRWQTLAELISASEHNKKGTCASLTDAFSWRFFESRLEKDKWIVCASDPLGMFSVGLQGVETTHQVFSFIFSRLFPGVVFPSHQVFHEVNEIAEKAMQRDANVLAQSHSMFTKEVARLTAQHQIEMAEKEKEVEVLHAEKDKELDVLREELREAKRPRTH
ncbi:hypothetical protein ABBQ38_000285 [Trebouxia sp. C0009 RCD-2024]